MAVKYYIEDIIPFLLEEDQKIGRKSKDIFFTNVVASKHINESSLDWINPSNPKKQKLFNCSKAKIIICDKSIKVTKDVMEKKCIVRANDPKHTFANIVNNIFVEEKKCGVHETAFVSPEAKLHKTAYIGPFTYIGKAIIGEDTHIHGNCFIYDHVKIGNKVIINAGTVIGSEGYGYVKNKKNNMIKFPHVSGVSIGNNVEIGSNTSIDRGSLSDTIIMDGAKIDNLVHIAHNVVVGKNSAVIANAMIGGSTIIGDNAWIAPSVSILEQLEISKEVIVGVGSVVTKDVAPYSVVAGVPAKTIKMREDTTTEVRLK